MLEEKKGLVRLSIMTIGVVLLTAIFAGCTGNNNNTAASGTIKVTGSTTVLPIAQATADAFMKNHSKADIQVSGGGSGVGVTAAGDGTADIGMSSRDITAAETIKYPAMVKTEVAKDCLVMIVHSSNTVSALTVLQIRGIYNGTYKNWKDLGGSDLKITLVGRDSASGTRDYFTSAVMNKQNTSSGMLELNSNGAVQSTVSTTPGAIGYVGLGYAGAPAKALKIMVGPDQIEASAANVLNNKYPLSRPLFMLTQGAPAGLAKSYIDFILSAKGQTIVEKEGFVKIK
jgi:phosphate transport system substrate-binding protein